MDSDYVKLQIIAYLEKDSLATTKTLATHLNLDSKMVEHICNEMKSKGQIGTRTSMANENSDFQTYLFIPNKNKPDL